MSDACRRFYANRGVSSCSTLTAPRTSTSWPQRPQTIVRGGDRRLLQLPLVFPLASVFSPARQGQGSPVTSSAIVTPHYSAPPSPASPPARSQNALLWKQGGSGAHLDSGKIEPELRGRGAQRNHRRREHMVPATRQTSAGSCFPTVLMLTPSCWDGGAHNVMRIIRLRWRIL